MSNLSLARHDYELEADSMNHVYLDHLHMGLGGDDSWSPSVHEVHITWHLLGALLPHSPVDTTLLVHVLCYVFTFGGCCLSGLPLLTRLSNTVVPFATETLLAAFMVSRCMPDCCNAADGGQQHQGDSKITC